MENESCLFHLLETLIEGNNNFTSLRSMSMDNAL